MNTSFRLIAVASVAAAAACSRADAANKYWAGTGPWNTANANWGTAGTVTLAMTPTANGMTFNTTGYTVTGGTIAIGGTNTLAAASRMLVPQSATLAATWLTILSTPENPYRILLTSLTSGTDQTPGSMGGS